jgi:hypothetical protein
MYPLFTPFLVKAKSACKAATSSGLAGGFNRYVPFGCVCPYIADTPRRAGLAQISA